LTVPTGTEIRPTSQKVREAIFNVLGPVAGLSVLDLFAGTGAMGLEALSRGARSCVFVERDPTIAEILRANVTSLGFEEASTVIVSDYRQALLRLAQNRNRFDLLFVDPPYRMLAEVEVTLRPLLSSVIDEHGVTVIEGARATQVSLGRTPVFDRTYGDTRVTMVATRRDAR
jgi:16S rRNA (guanine966-N2)-methyltransferase